MKINAISPAIQSINCQPIKPKFAGKNEQKENKTSDSFTPSDPYTTEQKYNFACRLAAYYKTQYENLLYGEGALV